MDENLDYRVNVKSADSSVDSIKKMAEKTKIPHSGTIGSIGGFGAIADIFEICKALDIEKPLLVNGTDGIGTKILIGQALNKLNTLGEDLVAMCVNDVICHGAYPFQFLDYIATGKFDENQLKQLLEGIVNGCIKAGCELVGGETAELQDMYAPGDFDAAGFTNAIVDSSKMLPRPKQIRITQSEYDKKYLQLSSDKHNISMELNRFDTADDNFAITMEYLLDIASNSHKVFKSSGIDKKRKIINFVFSNLQISKGNIEFSYKKPFNELVNLGDSKKWLEICDEFRTIYRTEILDFVNLYHKNL